jgi:hypothetical protein
LLKVEQAQEVRARCALLACQMTNYASHCGLYKVSPSEARGLAFLTGPACPSGSLTLASQSNKLCFVDCIHAWPSVSGGIGLQVLTLKNKESTLKKLE